MAVGGFRIGHAQNKEAATGCTVLLPDTACPAGVDVRGGGPASRETQLLSPLAHAEAVHAILLSGGSAFGLDAAGGVMKYLSERGIGFDTGVAKVPLVMQSCLFDLGVGRADVRPDAETAYEACENASYDAPGEGSCGAGCGCSVGKYRGMERAMKSGFGTFAIEAGAFRVGALVAVNALGDIYEDGRPIAGLLNKERTGLSCTLSELLDDAQAAPQLPNANTTLGIIVTNAKMTKTQLIKIAGMAHNGFARAIRPVHTMADGDSIYAVSTGDLPGDVNLIGSMAAYVMEKAIAKAVKSAKGAYGLISYNDLNK